MSGQKSRLDLTVLILSMNEGENIVELLPAIENAAEALGIAYEILIVEGGTWNQPVTSTKTRILSQQLPGYGGAIVAGLAVAKGDFILTMDADWSHDPTFLEAFWKARDQAHVIIGSRYVPGGTADMPALRKLLSRVLNVFFRFGLSMPWRDLSSGFRLYHAEPVRKLKLQSRDFDILQEILVKSFGDGSSITEVPIHYKPRKGGSSHARLFRFGIAYLKTFWRMWRFRNSIHCADYDDRAFDSRIPVQRYWQRARYEIIESFSPTKGKIVDIGCGSTRILTSEAKPIGLDIRINKLRYARKFGRPLLNASIWAIPFLDDSVDCVICSEVVEHIDPGIKPFLEMRRILKPNGTMILGTPDYSQWIWRWIEAIYGWIVPGGYADEHITHYTFDSLKKRVESLGFRVDQHKYICRSELILLCTLVEKLPIAQDSEETSISQINRGKTEEATL